MSDKNSELVWYIAREGQQHGPLSDVEMRLFVESGHLKSGDLVWNQDLPEWQPASILFPPQPAPAPPMPPPPPQPPSAPQARGSTPQAKSSAPQAKSANPAASDPKAQPTLSAALLSQQPAEGSASATPKAGAGELPSPEDVLPSFRTTRTASGPESRKTHSQPAPLEGYEDEDLDDEDAPRRGGRLSMMIGAAAVFAAAIGGGVVAFQNQDSIFKYMNEQAGTTATANNAPPVIKAEAGTKTASLEKPVASPAPAPAAATPPAAPEGPRIEGITVTVPPAQPSEPNSQPAAATDDQVPLATIDDNLQKSQLWRVIKGEFPEWYQERVIEISKLSNSASETDLSKHLIGKLVALRREHAGQALASSTDNLQSVATAFLANLKSLAGHSTEACYTFISKGETSPAVIALFPKPGYGDAIEGQIAAVFRAVADGRKTPVQRTKAGKPDYDVLAGELTKIGWSKADLGLFSNPQALAKAPPEQVCKMVQDWFAAHIAIEDRTVQERLLVETLRPVIAG
ncbi:MAG: hypothetical protein APF80_01380 [Alphaproteobacteria bacterium BRH_c36]|nr:MAG: hypothetical protein APF80_01380 [Alphaproteobacteria bacterium BRH_c36]